MPEPHKPPEKTIDELSESAIHEVIRIKTVFPFTLFPTEVVVDKLKVTIITSAFIYKHYFPVLLKDIKTVSVAQGIFFASLNFEIAGYETNPSIINFLRKDQALKAHQVIMGLIAVLKEKADKSMNTVPEEKLLEKLTEIGGTSKEPNLKDTKIKDEAK
jgi:hypothetical protein